MPSSDGKKTSEKNFGVSVKRKSSTSPSVLNRSPATKKRIAPIGQQYSSQIKSSYNLRNSHSSKSLPIDVVKRFNLSPNNTKNQKQSHCPKATDRCSFCSLFIPSDSSSFACFSCQFKYSDPKEYNKSRRSTALKSAAAKKSSGEPKVIAVVPAIEQKDILLINGRQRRKCIARPNRLAQSANGEASELPTFSASKLVSDEVKSVQINMSSESTGLVKQKPIDHSLVRCSKRVQYLRASRAKAPNDSALNPKKIAKISCKSVSNPKEVTETANWSVLNPKVIPETSNENALNSKEIAKSSNKSVLNPKEVSTEPKFPKRAVITRSKRLGTVLKESLFHSTEAIAKKSRNTDAETPSSDSHVKEAETASHKQAVRSSAVVSVMRKRKTYECDQCKKSFSHRQRFRSHYRKCKLRLPKVKNTSSADSASTVSNYSGASTEGVFEVDPKHLVLKGGNNVEENSTIRVPFDNGDISESVEHLDALNRKVVPFDTCGEISSDCADPLSTQGTCWENNSNFEEVLTNAELLPNAERSLDITEMSSEETGSCLDTLKISLGAKNSLLDSKESCLDTKEQCSNTKALCLDAAEPNLDVTESCLNGTKLSVDAIEPSLDTTEPNLDATEPNLDATEPSFDATEPSLDATVLAMDATEPSLDATVLDMDATEPSFDATEPSLDAIVPSLDATEPNLDATEPNLDATEPSLDATVLAMDATEPSLDATELCVDATVLAMDSTEPSLDATDTSLGSSDPSLDASGPSGDGTEPSADAIESSLKAIVPFLDAIEPSLDTTGSCLYPEVSYLNTEVSNFDATNNYLGTKEPCVDTKNKKVIEPSSAEAGAPLDMAEPSLEITVSCLDKLAPSLHVNKDCIDARESFGAVVETGLKGTKFYKEAVVPLAGKAELCVNGMKKQQLCLGGLETISQGQKTCFEKRWEACFEERHPSLERLEPGLEVPKFSLQFPASFLMGTDYGLEEMECNLKNNESSPEGFSSNHCDPGIDLGELNESSTEAESRFPRQKTFPEIDSAVAVSLLSKEKSDLKEAGTLLEGSLGTNSYFGGKELCTKETESNVGGKSYCLKDLESNLDVEISTLEEKEWCLGGVVNGLQGTYSHVQASKASLEGPKSCLVETKSSSEEVQIIFCPQITAVFSVTDDSKLETEPKEEISSCSVSESANNGYNADSDNLSETKDELKAENSEFNSMSLSTNDRRNTLKAEKLSKQASPKWKNCGSTKGKRKPEDSVKGKEPLPFTNHSSVNKLDDNELSSVCRSCGELSHKELTCRHCRDKQDTQFRRAMKALKDTFNHHLSNFINQNERMTHQNLTIMPILFKNVPPNFLASGDSIACQKTQTSAVQVDDISCQLKTFDCTRTDTLSLVTDKADRFLVNNLLCTPPSTVSAPPSPFSCSSSPEGPASQVAEGEPIEITLTEDMFCDFDIYCKGSEDSYLCMKFKSGACLRPLKKRDIAMHFFTTHDSSELRSTFNLLHDEE